MVRQNVRLTDMQALTIEKRRIQLEKQRRRDALLLLEHTHPFHEIDMMVGISVVLVLIGVCVGVVLL